MAIYVCRRCGYTQWFTKQPREIPIDLHKGTRLIKGSSPPSDHGPYR